MSDLIVRAIDLGFGNVKYVTDHIHGHDVVCGMFPSLAPPSLGLSVDQVKSPSSTHNVVEISVGDASFIVGKDVDHFLPLNSTRKLDQSYCESKGYAALMKGALAYIAKSNIDILILGLPNSTFNQFSATLKAVATGEHVVPNVRRFVDPTAPEMLTVNVREAFVVPQPMGGLFDHFIRHKIYSQMKSQVSLVIDIGYFTLDWIIAKGGKPNPARSGAWNGGMSNVLRAIADKIVREHGGVIADLSMLDEAIRTNSPFNFGGINIDIESHVAHGMNVGAGFLDAMAASAGDGSDINTIIVSGGGANFFLPLVQKKFPAHQVVVAKDPIYANVRGFQLVGEDLAGRMEGQNLRATA